MASLDAKVLAQNLKDRIKDMKALLGQHVPEARQILRKLIEGKLVCQPVLEGGRPGYQFAATGTYGGLFHGTNDRPEFAKARKWLEAKRHTKRAAGLVVDAVALDTPRATDTAAGD